MRKLLLALLLSSAAIPAFAQFGAFMSGSPTLPTGVTLHDQDGGPSYYTTNRYTNTIASRTFCNTTPFPACTGTTFASGWDDPKFFFFGMASTSMNSQSDANVWLAQGYNTAFGVNGGTSGTLNLLLNNGIGFIAPWQQLQRYISADRMPGAESVGIYTYDEPTTMGNGWFAPIAGIPTTTFTATATSGNMTVSGTPAGGTILSFENGTGINLIQWPYLNDGGVNLTPSNTIVSLGSGSGNGVAGTYFLGFQAGGAFTGSFGSETVTQTAVPATVNSFQDTRFFTVGLAGATNLAAGAIKSPGIPNLSLSTAMALVQSTPNGKRRHMDSVGSDIFWFTQGGDQGVAGRPSSPSGAYPQQHANNYDPSFGSPPFTFAQSMKGSHYGDFIDIQRQYNTTFSQPIWQIIEPLNANAGTPYSPQPQELNWAVWASIIHGAQGIVYFPNTQSGLDLTGCGVDSLFCTQINSPLTTSGITGTINASGTCGLLSGVRVLTVTGSITGYGLFPGMQSTAGITGGPATILQQCSENTATATGTTGGVSSSSVTLSGITGTVQPPARIVCTSSCPGLGGSNPFGTPTWVTGGGPSVYTLHDNLNFSSTGVTLISMPGSAGTYLIDQGTAAGGAMAFTQTIAMNTQITNLNAFITSMAPVIHSRFAYGFVTPSPNGYQFESGMTQFCGQGATQSLQSTTCGTTTGIETMAKYYEGPTYTATTGDTISRGFYIFSDTRYTELDTNISATFTLAAQCGVITATVIGESRTRPINNCSFTDTFANGWTVHIYELH